MSFSLTSNIAVTSYDTRALVRSRDITSI